MGQGKAYQKTLPRKQMAAGALFLNAAREILIVKPTYRDYWLIPGGVVEENESPAAACGREVREELGLDIALGPLLCLEYRSEAAEHTESLQFVFRGGVLSTAQIARIVLAPQELAAYAFVSPQEAMDKLVARLARRVQLSWQAWQQDRFIYAEDGVEVSN